MLSPWKIIKLKITDTNLNVHDNGVASKLANDDPENYFIKVINSKNTHSYIKK